MSDSEDSTENFMQRWSRRKRAAKTVTPDETEPPRRESREADADSAPSPPADSEAHVPAFDMTTLPPIDSITAASDVRAFLAAGVPEDATRAALRRAWLTDPTIRDFVGLAENQLPNPMGSLASARSNSPRNCAVSRRTSSATLRNWPCRRPQKPNRTSKLLKCLRNRHRP
jgi:Protein of unknown function (DUF3306)